MRPAFGILVALVLLAGFAFLPGPASPFRDAMALHVGPVACGSTGNGTPDGVIAPGEYGDNYFDPLTDMLAYFGCDSSAERLLHVGIVIPWSGWVGLLVQSSETWDGRMNEVRVYANATSAAITTLDAYANVTAGTMATDASAGGTTDVRDVSSRLSGAARVYEFAVPLNSSDVHDSQLASSGPFNFALEYNAVEGDLQSPPTSVSDLHSLTTDPPASRPAWTSLEFTAGLTPANTGTADFLVTLRDEGGFPIPFMEIEVLMRTAFGIYDAGPTVTNDQGVGEVAYTPRENGTYVLGAAFTGSGGFLASIAWRSVTVGSAFEGGGVGLGLFDGGTLELLPVEAIVVVVVLGVWATYAYAFFLMWVSMRRKETSLPLRIRPFNGRTRR